MHIPDNYLSPQTVALMTAIMVPVWGVSIHKVRKQMTQESVSKIGIGGAYSFIGMMFNIPIPGGTTGHAVGGTLILCHAWTTRGLSCSYGCSALAGTDFWRRRNPCLRCKLFQYGFCNAICGLLYKQTS